MSRTTGSHHPNRASLAVILGLLLSSLGCGVPQAAGVAGSVLLEGVPVADVEVQFIPESEHSQVGTPVSAYSDFAGKYSVARGQGVIAGKYRVCINDARVMMPGQGFDAGSGERDATATPSSGSTRVRIPRAYSDVTKTPFRIAVQPGDQTQNFELTLSQ